jgi:hypothetical protein
MADTNEENKQDTPPAADNNAQQEIIDNGKPLVASSGVESLKGIFDAFGDGKDPFAKEEPAADDQPVVEEKKEEEGVGTDFDNASTKKEEKKEQAKKDEAKAGAEKKDEEDYSDLKDEDLAPSPLDKPKTARRIKALLHKVEETNKIVATTKAELTEKASKLADLEKKLSESGSSNPDVQKQIDELAMYRRRYQLESDPEVKAKFDDAIVAMNADIAEILKANSAGEGLINLINDEGGLANLARLNKSYKLADGKSVTAKDLFNRIRDTLTENNPADALALDSAIQEQARLASEKVRYIEAEKGKAKEYFTAQEKAQQERSTGLKAKVEAFVTKLTNEDESFKDLAAPADASPEKAKEIKEENIYRKQLRDVLKASIGTTDPDEYLAMVKDATLLYPVKRSLAKSEALIKEKDAEILKLKGELDKVRGASSTTPKKSSISGGKQEEKKAAKPRTLEEEFERIGGGEG